MLCCHGQSPLPTDHATACCSSCRYFSMDLDFLVFIDSSMMCQPTALTTLVNVSSMEMTFRYGAAV